jgi:hypothetical protein
MVTSSTGPRSQRFWRLCFGPRQPKRSKSLGPWSNADMAPGAAASCLWCAAQSTDLAQSFTLRLTSVMKGRAVFVLLGLSTLGAYALGYHSAPVSQPPVRATASPSDFAQPVALSGPTAQLLEPASAPRATSAPAPSAKAGLPDEKPSASDSKRKAEAALTASAVAAIIVQASRAQYHAGGRPCACPDDTMRNGQACGGRSAYSRPGGASPLCYPSDVTAAMIETYRQRTASSQVLGR